METKTGARALGACLSITRILLAKEARVKDFPPLENR